MATTHIKDDGDLLAVSATILSSAQLSEAVYVPKGKVIVGIIPPTSWDGGNITISSASTESGTYYEHYDSGDASTAAAALLINTPVANKIHGIAPSHQLGVLGYVKINSASTVSADREVTLILSNTTL